MQAVVFDLYGTLITDTLPRRSLHEMEKMLELTPDQSKRFADLIRTQNFASFDDLLAMVCPEKVGQGPRFEDYMTICLESVALFEDSLPTLNRLMKAGYRTAIISNITTWYKPPVFKYDLHNKVDVCVLSCDVGVMKPDPRIYFYALKHLGVKPENALMVGDRLEPDVNAPRHLGMRALLINREKTSVPNQSISSLDEVFCYLEPESDSFRLQ